MKEKEWCREVGKRYILFELIFKFKTNGGVKVQMFSAWSVVLFHQGLGKQFHAHARETAFMYFLGVYCTSTSSCILGLLAEQHGAWKAMYKLRRASPAN